MSHKFGSLLSVFHIPLYKICQDVIDHDHFLVFQLKESTTKIHVNPSPEIGESKYQGNRDPVKCVGRIREAPYLVAFPLPYSTKGFNNDT